MKLKRQAGTIVAMLLCVHGAADAGKPAWCETDGMRKAETYVDKALTSKDPMDALASLVGSSCDSMKGKPVEKEAELAAARARWNKELGLTDADWATDVVPWALTDAGSRRSPTIWTDPKLAPSTMDSIAQYGLIQKSTFATNKDPLYPLDVFGSKLTMAGRLAYIEQCLDTDKPGQWVVCQPDIDAFDRKQLSAELRADKTPRGFQRMSIRIAAYRLKDKLAKRAADLEALVAKDEAWGKALAVAADAHKDWAANPPDASILAVASAMDDANATESSKAFDGCEDATWAAFSKAVAAIPAAKFKDIKDDAYLSGVVGVLVNDKNAYLAAVAVVTCHSKNPDILDRYLGAAMTRWPGFRGPRSYSLTKLVTSGIALDDRSSKIEYPELYRRFNGSSSASGGGLGAVASVKANGAKTHVEFVKKLQKVKVCTDWKETGQIEQITSTGAVIYHSNCTKYGTDTINNGASPADVETKYAAGLKAKSFAHIVENVVVSVQVKADAAPTRVFGIAVK